MEQRKKNNTGNIEHRTFTYEVRASGNAESRTVTGTAVVFDQVADSGMGWSEEIKAGALDEAITQDIRALFNHNSDKILARTKSKTLTLKIENDALRYDFEAPDTTAGNDLLVSLRRGDVSGSSFSFIVADGGDKWENRDGKAHRTISKIASLYDVGPVTYPFYETTEASLRSFDKVTERPEEKQELPDELKILKEKLKLRKRQEEDLLKL